MSETNSASQDTPAGDERETAPYGVEFSRLDAIAQAELVRRREVKPIELVEAAIARIERLNPELNAVVTPMYDEARRLATQLDLQGPFAGVPFLLKDLGADYAGVPTTNGSMFFKNVVPGEDSPLVRRYKQAGLIVLGKTNTPELGLMPTTEPRLFGPTRNPWDLTRTAGGSSGGAAAAVSNGLVPVAHGNDGGGSLRIPAACCGLFALKPSRGRMPGLGSLSFLATSHVISRSVRDSAAFLDITQGALPGSAYWAPPNPRRYLEEAATPPGRLRIAFSTKTVAGFPLHPDCTAAVREAAALCQALGHEVVEAGPEIDSELFMTSFVAVFAAGFAANLDAACAFLGKTPHDSDLEPATWLAYEYGKSLTAVEYLAALGVCNQGSTTVARFHAEHDIWLTATLGAPPLPLGTLTVPDHDLEAITRRFFEFIPNTPLANATGQPAMSVPLYWNDDGLPIGCHFAARFGEEAILLRLAAQLEVARPWAARWPPIAVDDSAGSRR